MRLPRGRVFNTYEGDDRRRAYPFDIDLLVSRNVNPNDWEPRWPISEKKRMAEVDIDKYMEEMPLHELISLWSARKTLAYKGKHPLFEVFMHFIFPATKEKTLSYIAVWRLRDKASFNEIARRLGKDGCIKVGTHTVKRYCEYIDRRISQFVGKLRMREKFANELKAEALKLDTFGEEDAREIVGGS